MSKPERHLYDAGYTGERVHKGYNYRMCYHPEFGNYVYQPDVRMFGFVEPYVTEEACRAFIDGYNVAYQRAAEDATGESL